MPDIKNNEIPDQSEKEPKVESSSQASRDVEKEKNILEEAVDNIEEGAKLVREKATVLTDKLKKGLSQAYDTSVKVADELSHIAQEYAEKYKAESEIKKLKAEKESLLFQLGEAFYKHRLTGNDFVDTFLNIKDTKTQLKQIEKIDKKIVETSRQLDLQNE